MEINFFEKAAALLEEINDINHSIARLRSTTLPIMFFGMKMIAGVQELFDEFREKIIATYEDRLKKLEDEFSQM